MGRCGFFLTPVYLLLSCSLKASSEYEFVGYHLLSSYLDCDLDKLNDIEGLKMALTQGVEASGATLLNTVEHRFTPTGFTMILLLSESHASIHTYPDQGACFIDFFTCGHTCSSEKFDRVLKEYLCPKKTNSHLFFRSETIAECKR